MTNELKTGCRQARKRFAAFDDGPAAREQLAAGERAAIEQHLHHCAKCAREYRIFTLTRAALDGVAATEPMPADAAFFRALRARIDRGPAATPIWQPAAESWATALLATARQLIPAMAVLLLLIIGATYMWSAEVAQGTDRVALRPRERVMFSDMYDYPAPTRDDVLETLVAAEEKENGK
jgi:anti-sigma factor RsiW